MIVRMAKVTVMGPTDLLMETLSLIQELGVMQVDDTVVPETSAQPSPPPGHVLDRKTVLEHQLYERLISGIDELLCCAGVEDVAGDAEAPQIGVGTLLNILPVHLEQARTRQRELEELTARAREYELYRGFLEAVGSSGGRCSVGDVECIGVRIASEKDLAVLQGCLDAAAGDRAALELVSGVAGEAAVGVIAVEREAVEELRSSMRANRIEMFAPPPDLPPLSWPEQLEQVRIRIAELKARVEKLQEERKAFAARWVPSYRETRARIESHLSLIDLTASIVKTRMCFFIHGWMAEADLKKLEQALQERFQGKVVVEEEELAEEDYSRIPTALQNPAYFEPFELFSRLLPMPPYLSFDLTPFLGIFFPIFFGMMLGDIGYGALLFIASLVLIRRCREEKNRNLRDGGKILGVCSLYTMIFGLLYGELFGTFGHEWLGLHPLFLDRHTSLVPMLCFAVAAGVVHVLFGLVLGVVVALRRQKTKEALFRLANIIVILCAAALLASWFADSLLAQMRKPLLLTIGVVLPMMLIVGGVLAPLELLKNVGNIISYARIMAVGLTSVLLAYVANYMAGRIGSVWAGIGVALLLHLFNLVLGVFAPTIHSLRLHYVEFLSKFMEPGGKEFRPLRRV
ncbi:MAG: hypothetical protein Kow0089_02170 [Desulfobulbaceae bacterium]